MAAIYRDKRPSQLRRATSHDYHEPGMYMLTIVTAGRKPLLGHLVDEPGHERVDLSELGRAILVEEMPKMHQFYPMVELWKACIMPDHIHMIINVKAPLSRGKHLGDVVRGFKGGCSRAWWRLQGCSPALKSAGTVLNSGRVPAHSCAGKQPLFQPGYHDRLLSRYGQLDTWKHYLNDNPRRLAVKRRFPQYFTVMHDVEVAGVRCQAVGNRFLLDIPDKVAVIVHRRYTPSERERLRHEWLAAGEAGAVLVSAAVAPMEQEVMREAVERGYSVILLRKSGFPRQYKPQGETFDLCSSGQMLMVSPWPPEERHETITREQCLFLNEMAGLIAAVGD